MLDYLVAILDHPLVLLIGIIVIIAFINIWISQSPAFKEYSKMSGNNYLVMQLSRGNYGEYRIFKALYNKDNPTILANVYLPHKDELTEVDLIYIHATGIYVIESKNYSGWIFGNEDNREWTMTVKGGKRYRFFSPVWQNWAHISAIKEYLNLQEEDRIYSYIVFGNNSTLKNVTVKSADTFVMIRKKLRRTLKRELAKNEVVFTPEEVDFAIELLKARTGASPELKKQHIASVKKKKNQRRRM